MLPTSSVQCLAHGVEQYLISAETNTKCLDSEHSRWFINGAVGKSLTLLDGKELEDAPSQGFPGPLNSYVCCKNVLENRFLPLMRHGWPHGGAGVAP